MRKSLLLATLVSALALVSWVSGLGISQAATCSPSCDALHGTSCTHGSTSCYVQKPTGTCLGPFTCTCSTTGRWSCP